VLTKSGFIYVINFGLGQEEIEAHYDIAQELFDSHFSEKKSSVQTLKRGSISGTNHWDSEK